MIQLVLIVLFLGSVNLRTLNSFSKLMEKEDYEGMLTYINSVYFFLAVSRDFYVKAFLILSRVGFSSMQQVQLISFFVDVIAIISISPFALVVAQKEMVAEIALLSFSASWLNKPLE